MLNKINLNHYICIKSNLIIYIFVTKRSNTLPSYLDLLLVEKFSKPWDSSRFCSTPLKRCLFDKNYVLDLLSVRISRSFSKRLSRAVEAVASLSRLRGKIARLLFKYKPR